MKRLVEGLDRGQSTLIPESQEPSEALAMRTTRLEEKIAKLKEERGRLEALEALPRDTEDQQISLSDPDARSMATSGLGSGAMAAVTTLAERSAVLPGSIASRKPAIAQITDPARRTTGHDRLQPTVLHGQDPEWTFDSSDILAEKGDKFARFTLQN